MLKFMAVQRGGLEIPLLSTPACGSEHAIVLMLIWLFRPLGALRSKALVF